MWNNHFFERVTLKSLGLRVQLGHQPGEICVNPKPAFNDDFTILDNHGVHAIGLDFCACESAKAPPIQLLRRRWYPATGTYPRSAATFRLLETFQLLSFESKVSGHEFYRSLARRTDNMGIEPTKVCCHGFTGQETAPDVLARSGTV